MPLGVRAFQQPDPKNEKPGHVWLALGGFLGLCALVAASDAAITQSSVHGWYAGLHHPPGTPPNWLFGPVWSVLYACIAVSGWRVWRLVGRGAAIQLWGWQLLVNALWTPAFFGLRSPSVGALVILALVMLIARLTRAFLVLDRPAAWLLMPYLAWVMYASYLNLGVVWLNKGP